jgi:hypothetical protein
MDKQLPTPTLIYAKLNGAGGLYIHPSKKPILIRGEYIEPSKGTIIVGIGAVGYDCLDIESTLAHEWRHHWQWWNGYRTNNIRWVYSGNYEEDIVRYFSNSPNELDALRFEVQQTNSEYSKWWLSLLQQSKGEIRCVED